ncbi:MAG: hypothetical protein ACTSRH_09610 [Promethearchaeota archaeon]
MFSCRSRVLDENSRERVAIGNWRLGFVMVRASRVTRAVLGGRFFN